MLRYECWHFASNGINEVMGFYAAACSVSLCPVGRSVVVSLFLMIDINCVDSVDAECAATLVESSGEGLKSQVSLVA